MRKLTEETSERIEYEVEREPERDWGTVIAIVSTIALAVFIYASTRSSNAWGDHATTLSNSVTGWVSPLASNER